MTIVFDYKTVDVQFCFDFLHYIYTEAYFRWSVVLGCSYLFEMENEVHNNSSVEIYYQVS